jgi:hypothetical protein
METSTMRIAIMQPYLFPYIGYFQLIYSVDKFVVYDDVQYIKHGWINRNKIRVNGNEYLFTFSVKKASTYLNINERYFSERFSREKDKLLKLLQANYSKAPFYKETTSLVNEILEIEEDNISLKLIQSLKMLCSYIGITTSFCISSELQKNNELCGENQVIEINKRLKSTHYINSIGGLELYNRENFLREGITLNFIKSKLIYEEQLNNKFIPFLSIIDVLMFNSVAEIRELLNQYELV